MSDAAQPSTGPEGVSSGDSAAPLGPISSNAPAKGPRMKIGSQRTEAARFAPKPPPVNLAPAPKPPVERAPRAEEDAPDEAPRGERRAVEAEEEMTVEQAMAPIAFSPLPSKFPAPRIERGNTAEMDEEIAAALGGQSIDDLFGADAKRAPGKTDILEPQTLCRARIVSIHSEDVFIDLGGRNQGVLSLRQFATPPVVGAILEVNAGRFDADEGLYQSTLPGAAQSVEDWSQINVGMVVEARVTGHNKGGLECEVNRLRGFMPAGQISPYRVENLEQFVGQTFNCVVTEANPERRNLVLSRRGVLERERQEAKEKMVSSLQVGDVREGLVRSLQEFGAFVDIGGVDGLLHISQLSWQRVKHPSEVLEVGQAIKVKVQKIDPASGKISLAFRDLMENPWTGAARKYPVGSRVTGTVTRLMEFGAFVQLEPGVEGLVHISELAHQRVFRAGDIVKEGQSIEAQVSTVDEQNQRIGLSIKALQARPSQAGKGPKQDEDAPVEPLIKSKGKFTGTLKGGVGRSSGGEQFGLNW
jgi:ribosomal protein S1